MGLFDKEEIKVDIVEKTPAEPVVEDEPVVEESPAAEVAIISSTTKIEGNITTDGSIVINGDVQGNVTTKGNLVLSGTASGEIYCNSILIEADESDSDIIAEENIIIAEGTVVNGNINCRNISVRGTVCGDISSNGSVFLKSTAKITGDITAKQIGMECGAVINGNVAIN